ncbi:MAG: hypothetical protein L0Z62_39205 [Gemmataceae bacterium]|nr:hypothetical protein [Gemmataceae bacterium]
MRVRLPGWTADLAVLVGFLLLTGGYRLCADDPHSPPPPRASLGFVESIPEPVPPALPSTKDKQEKPEDKKKAEADKGKEDKEKKVEWLEVGKNKALTVTWDNGLHAQTADQSFKLHLGGRLEFDNTWFTQDSNLQIGPSADTRLTDGTLFRRARLRADGSVWEFIDFALEVNFANIQDVSNVENDLVQVGSVGLTEVAVTFREVPVLGNVRAGHQKAPVGLERYSSANAWYYLERSSLFDAFLGPNHYQNGVVVFNSYLDDRLTLAGAFTRHGKSDVQSFGFGAEDGGYAGAVRVTGLPVYLDEGRVLLHVGAGFAHQSLRGHQFAVASRPLLRSGAGNRQTPNVVATGTFFTPNGASVLDLEWALVWGRFAMSAEYAVARIANVFDTFNGLVFSGPRGDATYQAAYIEAGYFLTPGDRRHYDRKTATWARTVPQENAFLVKGEEGKWCSGRGAVQLLARYTFLDLVSGSPVLTTTSGGAGAGQQHDITLGVNWYLNPQTHLMVNYIWTHLDSVTPGASGNFQGLGCRLHFDF